MGDDLLYDLIDGEAARASQIFNICAEWDKCVGPSETQDGNRFLCLAERLENGTSKSSRENVVLHGDDNLSAIRLLKE
jgi:hypothetical protein